MIGSEISCTGTEKEVENLSLNEENKVFVHYLKLVNAQDVQLITSSRQHPTYHKSLYHESPSCAPLLNEKLFVKGLTGRISPKH